MRAALLLASLAEAQPGQTDLARKALSEAIGAGQMDLALSLAHRVPPARLLSDARLLLVAEEIKRGHPERALPWLAVSGDNGDLSFLATGSSKTIMDTIGTQRFYRIVALD